MAVSNQKESIRGYRLRLRSLALPRTETPSAVSTLSAWYCSERGSAERGGSPIDQGTADLGHGHRGQ